MKIPKVVKHKIAKLPEGVGSVNSKEYCYCDDCIKLKLRRDKIYNKWYHRFKRWVNNNF